ncbi:MAG: STAS domain-containing protein [Terracidiphilus sp.]
MGIIVEQRERSTEICLEGVIDIASAAELKTILLDALKQDKTVRIALDAHSDLDVTAVQLLWAAEHEARAVGLEFTFAGGAPEPVASALKEAGFEKFPVPV